MWDWVILTGESWNTRQIPNFNTKQILDKIMHQVWQAVNILLLLISCISVWVTKSSSALVSTVDKAVISQHFTLLSQTIKHNSTSKVCMCVSDSPDFTVRVSESSNHRSWSAPISPQGRGWGSGLCQLTVSRITVHHLKCHQQCLFCLVIFTHI